MNDLKSNYFFLNDFFLPQNNNLNANDFLIINEKDHPDLLKFFIYPVLYRGFFDNRAFILLKREDFSYTDKDEFLKEITDFFHAGLKNIYALNFKKLQVSIESYIDDISFDSNYLLLQYEKKTIKGTLPFSILITKIFLRDFIIGLISSDDRTVKTKNKKSIQELLDYFKLRLYRDSITSFWDLRNFIYTLEDKDIQHLITLLLKSNIIEETMLTGFIAGFSDNETKRKLLKNLSRNVQEDVQKNISFMGSDKRWIDESFYLIRSGIEKLIFNDQLSLSQLKYILQIKERLKKEKYLTLFQKRPYEDYLNEMNRKEMIEKIKIKVDRKTLLVSLKSCRKEDVKLFMENLSRNASDEFLADLIFYNENAVEEEVINARMKVIEAMKDLIYDEKSRDIVVFASIIINLTPVNLRLLLEESGIIKFIQATLQEKKEVKKHILGSVKGIPRDLILDLYSGKVRFKKSFGELTVKVLKQDILRIYYFLKDNGKFL
ncbi:MAG: hypothetical protein KKH98_00150 [Spirochaetes bacterium]|nr:hypothetical protein [Spirochaetota bacterium]